MYPIEHFTSRYSRSRSDFQLRGGGDVSVVGDCDPASATMVGSKVLVPCGLIASSQFNGVCFGAFLTDALWFQFRYHQMYHAL